MIRVVAVLVSALPSHTMHRVLLVGFESRAIGRALKCSGDSVVWLDTCETATEIALDLFEAFGGKPPDVVVVDLSAARDCFLIRHMRSLIREVWGEDIPMPPFLGLISRHILDSPDLPAFADDFMLPPFATREAVARVGSLLFRKRHVGTNNTISYADLTLDLDACTAMNGTGKALPLTPREFDLLRFLCSNRGKFFSRDTLLNLVWGVQFAGGERTVDIHVRRLRAKLPPKAADKLETRRGVGYGMQEV